MEKKEDIRITKTKRDLCNALYGIMLDTPFDKITVGQICEKAIVNRMTFYKHYSDKYELLEDLLLRVKRSIIERIAVKPDLSLSSEEKALEFLFLLIDAVVDECLEQKKLLSVVGNDDIVLTMVSTTIEKSVYELLCELNKSFVFKYKIEYLAAAITGAASQLLKHWLFHNSKNDKDEFLAYTKEFLNDLIKSKILFV